jgi:hypothetical protein
MTKMSQEDNRIYTDKHNHYTILASFEGEYVRWSRQEGLYLEDEEVSTIEEFNNMIESEEWKRE